MARVLQAPSLIDRPRVLDAPNPSLDAVAHEVIDRAVAEAYSRGRAEGYAQGHATGWAEGNAAGKAGVEAVRRSAVAALERAASELAAIRAEQAEADVALALTIARAVVGREPHDNGVTLAGQVRAAIAAIDDAPLTVRVAPTDVPVVAEALADLDGITVLPEDRIAPGEGTVVGPWARAEILRATAWAAAEEVLGAGA